MKIPIFTGPTGVGKSAFAVEFAKKTNGEIVSVDSMQIYKHMNVGTAKVKEKEKKGVPHHMIDVLKPNEEFDVERFRKRVLEIVEEIIKRKSKPVLVGGSGLYVHAIKYGIFEGPSKNKTIRSNLEKIEKESPGALRRLLKKVDPIAYEKFEENDKLRAIRALEVYILSGQPISTLWNKRKEDKRFIIFVLNMKREALYDRINKRVDKMFKEGLVEEVKKLIEMGFSKDLPAMKSIGYKEVVKYLEGEMSFEECKEEIKKQTRRFAKRQLTWFRKYDDAVWLDLSEKKEDLFDKVLKKLNWGD
ncbi:tRNA (adenosine(37)-N6)-dimethylallyltransferase MiaA [Mesoaciditoga lauensis]|uniref:tRNA (adenosine(37)-N6)-dimethylallyltransferase MiaA n=1 Tax=Mesoaciditoga lauensis TaxID=1495039 RepID=UPI0005698B71|nr:tRNA (adenosine(37)-N6)-dimethylallyltransferase MiaA [Mesoaciditoga lauensis]